MVPGRRKQDAVGGRNAGGIPANPHPTRWPWCRFGNPQAQGPALICSTLERMLKEDNRRNGLAGPEPETQKGDGESPGGDDNRVT
jgi:hypothetical protein